MPAWEANRHFDAGFHGCQTKIAPPAEDDRQWREQPGEHQQLAVGADLGLENAERVAAEMDEREEQDEGHRLPQRTRQVVFPEGDLEYCAV